MKKHDSRTTPAFWLGTVAAMTLTAVFHCSALAQGPQVVAQVPAAQVGVAKLGVAAGKRLFEHRWEPGQATFRGGDGLGPAHNDVSCVACHIQGGVGGGGPLEKNVDVLSIPSRTDSNKRLKIHPGFLSAEGGPINSIVLHKFSTDPRYAAQRAALVRGLPVSSNQDRAAHTHLQRQMELEPLQALSRHGVAMIRSQRNTPALFGGGLIDAIPDAEIRGIATKQRMHGEISGRVAPVPGGVGRFGWRGQTEHLADFVFGACANELGLNVPTHRQPANPSAPEYKPPGLDLNAEQCASLVNFVASLPAPQPIVPADPDQAKLAGLGYRVFNSVGCSVCHVESLGPAVGLFSDLLLHDMGAGLGDPFAAAPATRTVMVRVSTNPNTGQQQVRQVSTSGYYGAVGATPTQVPIPSNSRQEWQTPPLWGVGDSAPYLHDGRAATLMEAVLLHGGEAKQTTGRLLARPVAERLALIAFLKTLVAPRP